MKHKYPIGTQIKYIGFVQQDVGKEGRIVGYVSNGVVAIVVQGSHVALQIFGDSEHQWTTDIENIEILSQKNEQLLFDFMNE